MYHKLSIDIAAFKLYICTYSLKKFIMVNQKTKYTFSSIIKEEEVKSLDHHILPNTLVLEITHPFPGYYFGSHFITSSSKPNALLMVLKKAVDFEFFYRSIKRIKGKLDFEFGSDLAEVHIFGQNFNAIRIRDLQSFDQLESVQKAFLEVGFDFAKKKSIESKARIKVNKFNSLRYEDGVYYSNSGSGFIYLAIGKELDWKTFEKITMQIKHNFSIKFDAGIGVFFHHGEIEDVIRIYSKEISEDDLHKLHKLYLREIVNV